jgi:hypothetical protein
VKEFGGVVDVLLVASWLIIFYWYKGMRFAPESIPFFDVHPCTTTYFLSTAIESRSPARSSSNYF